MITQLKFDLNYIFYITPQLNMIYTAPCFSGDCGFCEECCSNNYIKTNPNELTMRAHDAIKFIGKNKVEEENDKYSKAIKQKMIKTDYRNPTDIGYMPRFVNYEIHPSHHMKYKLNQKIHSEVCSNRICQVLFHSSHEEIQKSYYPKLPVYTRVTDNNHHLCSVCIKL